MVFEALNRLLAGQRPVQASVEGPRLRLAGPGAWFAERELVYPGGGRVPIRMVVLEDPPAELSLYSPVELDDGTVEALAGLGTVRRIIVPNRFHTSFVDRALARYPDARLLVPAADGGVRKGYEGRAVVVGEPGPLGGHAEIYPLSLRDGLVELVVYADRAELLIVSDLLFNLHQAAGLQRWFYRLNGIWRRPAVSRLARLVLLKDRRSVGAFYRWAMTRPFSRISMSHGSVISTGARETFYQLFHRYRERLDVGSVDNTPEVP